MRLKRVAYFFISPYLTLVIKKEGQERHVENGCKCFLTYVFVFQKQAMLVRQLEEEVVKSRQHAKETNPEIKAHIEALQIENDHLTREVAILKETIKVR